MDRVVLGKFKEEDLYGETFDDCIERGFLPCESEGEGAVISFKEDTNRKNQPPAVEKVG